MKFLILFLLLFTTLAHAKHSAPRKISLNAYNTVMFSSEVNTVSIENALLTLSLKRQQLALPAPIYLIIDTTGGFMDAAEVFIKTILLAPELYLVCRDCQSAGAFMLEATTTPRLVTAKSHIMLHHMTLTLLASTSASEIEEFRKESDLFDKVFYARMGITKESYQKKIEGHHTLDLIGEDIVKNKLADELVIIECDDHISGQFPDFCEGVK